ncbi:Oxoglutarate/iron-dependent dioxygenase [Penicillium angulare]|uniref:Oxoglutarate/iron-dependent dioxygenase n=1 Tax=Penicillium angulare TaxID=116970 RepID=UPI002541D204|nr:Oxoglutarate/iron-dependent dioxygenase [Penicillium angulare]KAJ5261120.1 Oxoglutarate/iron-dependent dioxygenase [Penicillium angulare]
MAKRTLDTFFKPISPPAPPKRAKPSNEEAQSETSTPTPPEPEQPPSTHPTYPIPIPQLPSHISISLTHGTPAREGRCITNQPHLDLLYFQPYITRTTANELFKFLRNELPFYRVQYQIKRGGIETQINTPRYTTVFGVDDSSRFVESTSTSTSTSRAEEKTQLDTESPTNNKILITTQTQLTSQTKYTIPPRPIPHCLEHLRQSVESATGSTYNFCLVNYYASGEDSISFHSDDERFLGDNPNIASLSLGGEREFQMKHKPPQGTSGTPSVSGKGGSVSHGKSVFCGTGTTHSQLGGTMSQARTCGSIQMPMQMQNPAGLRDGSGSQQIKMPLGSGDMVVMRGETQSNWLHSIPKKRGRAGDAVRGRINITFRKAVVPAGTNNYYHYNVGYGPVYRWDAARGVMDLMK